ncbi:aldolase/citrate lyase family protein, partial [Klebsiella pneumoniae]|uniref:aldolase/citrate lyase family protein n=1 Tax=Klebsiella pneumoniae TaxID=573 RepID=UPI003F8FB2B3
MTAVNNLKAIAETEGVDGVFFGPADLSASMGHRGEGAPTELDLRHARHRRRHCTHRRPGAGRAGRRAGLGLFLRAQGRPHPAHP